MFLKSDALILEVPDNSKESSHAARANGIGV
jgi:hypothetical protein